MFNETFFNTCRLNVMIKIIYVKYFLSESDKDSSENDLYLIYWVIYSFVLLVIE
jgi:hypothetical protein